MGDQISIQRFDGRCRHQAAGYYPSDMRQNDINIIQGRVSKDHVHIYVSYPPKLSVSEMVRLMKGRSSRKIQEEFPQLGKYYWGKHFWGIGYAAFSSGHVTDEMIQDYLKHHKNYPNHQDDNFAVE